MSKQKTTEFFEKVVEIYKDKFVTILDLFVAIKKFTDTKITVKMKAAALQNHVDDLKHLRGMVKKARIHTQSSEETSHILNEMLLNPELAQQMEDYLAKLIKPD